MDRDPELRSGRLLFRFDQLPEGVELPAPRVFAELRSVRRAGLSGRVSRIPRTWLREVRRTDLESPVAGGRIARRQDKNLYLYKLHGSIDWRREPETGKLTYSDSSSTIKIEESSLIFGTAYKLQYVDPFLFLVYQLRRWSLEARLILVVGYGFRDEHINGILCQALRANAGKQLLAVMWDGSSVGDGAVQDFKHFVTKELGLESDKQVNIIVSSAKDFLGEQLSLATVSQFFPPEEELFQEIRSEAATPAGDEGPRLVASS